VRGDLSLNHLCFAPGWCGGQTRTTACYWKLRQSNWLLPLLAYGCGDGLHQPY